MKPDLVAEVRSLLERATPEQQLAIFRWLRSKFPIHALEAQWNMPAEAILDAISRASDLTQRGIRGILAESSFVHVILPPLLEEGWRNTTPDGDVPFDVRLEDGVGPVRVQIKLQRRKDGRPMTGAEAPKRDGFSERFFVVETQKTRAGTRGGAATRPYRFGEFDILAVSLAPSTNDWSRFLYTVATWLLPDDGDDRLVHKYQPVPPEPTEDWTDDLATCIEWSRSGKVRRLAKTP